MSPVKIAAKRAVRYNLIAGAIIVLFAAYAINKAQSLDFLSRGHSAQIDCLSGCR